MGVKMNSRKTKVTHYYSNSSEKLIKKVNDLMLILINKARFSKNTQFFFNFHRKKIIHEKYYTVNLYNCVSTEMEAQGV